jgi:hypothetical protein
MFRCDAQEIDLINPEDNPDLSARIYASFGGIKLASRFCAKKALGRRGWRRAGPGEEDPV